MTREQKCCDNCIEFIYGSLERCENISCKCHTEPEVSGEEWEKELDERFPPNNPEDVGKDDRFKAFIRRLLRETRAAARIEGLTEALTLYHDNVREWTPEFVEAIQSKITSIREDAQLEDANESLKEHLSKL
jgi:hypothetical protein